MPKNLLTTLSLLVLFISPISLSADPIYRWQTPDGKVHYSTKAPSKEATPAKLPPILKSDIKVAVPKVTSCDKHGGINCQAGMDTDGSVICFDGFREASMRFRFSCSTPKLEISSISDLKEDGSFSVFVRNTKSVTAQNPSLVLNLPEGKKENLTGPKEIEAFASAEFIYQPAVKLEKDHPENMENKEQPPIPKFLKKPSPVDLNLTCANCQ